MSIALHGTPDDAASPLLIGRFVAVTVGHRRVLGDGELVATRGADGRWRIGDRRYQSIDVAKSSGRVRIAFSRPWGPPALPDRGQRLVLTGNRALLDRDRLARDDDDSRQWIRPESGDAYGVLIVT